MLDINIGNTILKLRKSKNITQDELGKILGVSNQAVSKWETGSGLPDIELLPLIADYFNISIDKLFGRDVSDYMEIAVETAKYIQSFDDDTKMNAIMEHCCTISRALFTSSIEHFKKGETLEQTKKDLNCETYSQLLDDRKILFMRLNDDFPYFLFMPEAPCGFGNALPIAPEYHKLFNMLGEEDNFKCLYLLYQRENKPFTPKLFEKHFGIEQGQTLEILDKFAEYELIETSEIELDDEVQTVYNFRPNSSFVPLLAFAKAFIYPPHNFHYNFDFRSTPYFQKKGVK